MDVLGKSSRVIVAGYFDPLTAVHARRLEALAITHGPLHVAIMEPPDAILPAEARAVLVASLRCVAAVAVASGPVKHPSLVDESGGDLERRRELTALVRSRHGQ